METTRRRSERVAQFAPTGKHQSAEEAHNQRSETRDDHGDSERFRCVDTKRRLRRTNFRTFFFLKDKEKYKMDDKFSVDKTSPCQELERKSELIVSLSYVKGPHMHTMATIRNCQAIVGWWWYGGGKLMGFSFCLFFILFGEIREKRPREPLAIVGGCLLKYFEIATLRQCRLCSPEALMTLSSKASLCSGSMKDLLRSPSSTITFVSNSTSSPMIYTQHRQIIRQCHHHHQFQIISLLS